LKSLQEIVETTTKPVAVYNFTNHFNPITVPELGTEDLNEGIGNVIQNLDQTSLIKEQI